MSKRRKQEKSHFSQMRVTSTISITMVLFVVGVLAFTLLVADQLSRHTRENIVVNVMLNDSTTEASKTRLENYLAIAPYVKSFNYISKEDALNDYINDLGEDPASFLGYNPLLASFELNLQSAYANNDSLNTICQRLRNFDSVADILYQKDILHLLNNNINKISFFFVIIAAILLFTAIVLTNNTIRLSIYSKRFLIRTMNLVGAKPSFIRRPFVWQSVRSGIIASILAFGAIVGALYYLQHEYMVFKEFLTTEFLLPIAVCIFVFGLLITWLSASFAVTRYIRIKSDKLYYI